MKVSNEEKLSLPTLRFTKGQKNSFNKAQNVPSSSQPDSTRLKRFFEALNLQKKSEDDSKEIPVDSALTQRKRRPAKMEVTFGNQTKKVLKDCLLRTKVIKSVVNNHQKKPEPASKDTVSKTKCEKANLFSESLVVTQKERRSASNNDCDKLLSKFMYADKNSHLKDSLPKTFKKSEEISSQNKNLKNSSLTPKNLIESGILRFNLDIKKIKSETLNPKFSIQEIQTRYLPHEHESFLSYDGCEKDSNYESTQIDQISPVRAQTFPSDGHQSSQQDKLSFLNLPSNLQPSIDFARNQLHRLKSPSTATRQPSELCQSLAFNSPLPEIPEKLSLPLKQKYTSLEESELHENVNSSKDDLSNSFLPLPNLRLFESKKASNNPSPLEAFNYIFSGCKASTLPNNVNIYHSVPSMTCVDKKKALEQEPSIVSLSMESKANISEEDSSFSIDDLKGQASFTSDSNFSFDSKKSELKLQKRALLDHSKDQIFIEIPADRKSSVNSRPDLYEVQRSHTPTYSNKPLYSSQLSVCELEDKPTIHFGSDYRPSKSIMVNEQNQKQLVVRFLLSVELERQLSLNHIRV